MAHEQFPEALAGAPRSIAGWSVPKLLITLEGTELKVSSLVANETMRRWIRREAAHSGETEEVELEKQINLAVRNFIAESGLSTRVTWAA